MTRALMGEIKTLTEQRGGKFLVFGTNTLPHTLGLLGDSPDEVYKIGGKFYRISVRQYRENVEYLNGGFDYHWIPLTLEPSRVGPADVHLNEHAVDQVMKDLASVVRHIYSRDQIQFQSLPTPDAAPLGVALEHVAVQAQGCETCRAGGEYLSREVAKRARPISAIM